MITTCIPTPLDISTDPRVLGANLGLAAVATILLVAMQELLNSTLSEHERAIQRVLGRVPFLGLSRVPGTRLSEPVRRRPWLANLVRLAVIVAVCGLVFSLLERSWNPFTPSGIYLFLAMAIACGLIGWPTTSPNGVQLAAPGFRPVSTCTRATWR